MDTMKDSDEVKRVLAACFDDFIAIYMDGRSPTVWFRTNEKNVIPHCALFDSLLDSGVSKP